MDRIRKSEFGDALGQLVMVLLRVADQHEWRHRASRVTHAGVGLEQTQQILAWLQRTNKEHVTWLQTMRRSHAIRCRRVGGIGRRDTVRNRNHLRGIQRWQRLEHIEAGVLRHRYHPSRTSHRPRHDAPKGQRVRLWHQFGREAI